MHGEKAELVHDNPLFSPSQDSQEKCWDVIKETSASTKKAARSMSGLSGSSSDWCEIPVASPINTLKSWEKASPESSRKAMLGSGSKNGNVVQAMEHKLVDDESQDMEQFRMRMRKFMEQEDEAGHNPSPLIIQYGGVACYHPVYSPCAPRPRFLRFQGVAPDTPKDKDRPTQDMPEIKRSAEELKEDMPQSGHCSRGGHEGATAAENGPELALNAGLDNKGNESICPSSFEPAAGHTEGLRSVKTDHKITTNYMNRKHIESHFRRRKSMPMIWTVSIVLVFSFSLFSVMPVRTNSFSTNFTATENCKDQPVPEAQPLGLRLTGLTESSNCLQERSMALMKSIINLDRIKESSRASFSEISDFGLLCFRSGFRYFRSVGGCLMTELYGKVKSISTKFVVKFKIFCMDLLRTMMNVVVEVPRFCKCFYSEIVIDNYSKNARAESRRTSVGKFGKPASRAPSNRLGHKYFLQSVLPLILGMDICPREDNMNTCSIMETQGIKHDRDHADFYIKDEAGPDTVQQYNGIGLIQEQANSVYAEIHNSPKLDQISAEDQENRLCTGSEISENSLSLPEQTEIEQMNLEDLNINGTSEGSIIELNPHEFWWLIWASLLIVATLLFILLMFRSLIPHKKLQSGPYSPQTSKNMLNKPGGDDIEKQKPTARYFGEITMESTESPRLGSFIDYVVIPVSERDLEVKNSRLLL